MLKNDILFPKKQYGLSQAENVQILLLIHSRQFTIYNILFRVHGITNSAVNCCYFSCIVAIGGEEWEGGQGVVEICFKIIWHPRS